MGKSNLKGRSTIHLDKKLHAKFLRHSILYGYRMNKLLDFIVSEYLKSVKK